MLINPRVNEVTGFESPVCLEMIISLMVGMIENDKIPPVQVYTFDNGRTFHLPYDGYKYFHNTEGGHHRVMAAYLLGGKCLEIEIIENLNGMSKMETPSSKAITFNRISIKSNPKEKYNFEREVTKKYYRDLPSVEDFFGKYRKINMALKYGAHEDYSLTRQEFEKILFQIGQEVLKSI